MFQNNNNICYERNFYTLSNLILIFANLMSDIPILEKIESQRNYNIKTPN